MAAVAQYDTDAKEYAALGADVIVHLYDGAGASVAEAGAAALADRA